MITIPPNSVTFVMLSFLTSDISISLLSFSLLEFKILKNGRFLKMTASFQERLKSLWIKSEEIPRDYNFASSFQWGHLLLYAFR